MTYRGTTIFFASCIPALTILWLLQEDRKTIEQLAMIRPPGPERVDLLPSTLKSFHYRPILQNTPSSGLMVDHNRTEMLEQRTKDFNLQGQGYQLQTHVLNCGATEQMKRIPSGLIIGEAKCGTSALLVFLSMHQHIILPNREINYFAGRKYSTNPIEKYIDKMPLSCPNDVTVEKTPVYFRDRWAPGRVFRCKKNMRLILIVRDPIQRVLSNYIMATRNKQSDVPTVEDLVLSDKKGEPSVNIYSQLVSRSVYSEHLAKWLAIFPRDQLFIIDGDKFIKGNPAQVLRKVAAFLGVEPYYEDQMFYYDTTKGYYCPTFSGCLPDSKGHIYPKTIIKNKTIELLRSYFKPYNEKFSQLAGIEFEWN